jgi:NAD(P)-dependent dehydrogenase (short-subunit alcohol dehydrogenase family)
MRTILITGGGRGIGAATARLAAEHGYRVAINYARDAESAEQLASELTSQGAHAITLRADVSRESEVEALFEGFERHFGALDVLVNNAGVVDRQSRVDAMHEPRLLRMFAINVIGTMLCAAAAVRRMSTGRGGTGGAIVNVSSAAARLGSSGEYVDYAASKAAVDTFTIGLAREVAGEGIRVNAVRPGIISTDIHASGGDPGRAERLGPMLPMRRSGSAEEVARAIMWLASDQASYCTGSILDITEGR